MRRCKKNHLVIPARIPSKKINPDQAIRLLKEGNQRFTHGQRSTPELYAPYDLQVLASRGETPFGIILACSDDQPPIETLFDTEIGSLFIYHVSANLVSELLLTGIEHALTYFDIPLIVILGHSHCNIIQAAFNLSHKQLSQELSSGKEQLLKTVLEAEQSPSHPEELLWMNLQHNARRMKKESPLISQLLKKGKLKIVGAWVEPTSGRVQFSNPTLKKRTTRRKAA